LDDRSRNQAPPCQVAGNHGTAGLRQELPDAAPKFREPDRGRQRLMSVAMGRIAVAAALGALVGGAVTVGLIATEGDTPVRDPHGGKEAAAYAESLLDRVALPKGARPFSGGLPQETDGAPWRNSLD